MSASTPLLWGVCASAAPLLALLIPCCMRTVSPRARAVLLASTAGVLLGIATLDLLPEALESSVSAHVTAAALAAAEHEHDHAAHAGHDHEAHEHAPSLAPFLSLACGFLLLFVMERVFGSHGHLHDDSHAHAHSHSHGSLGAGSVAGASPAPGAASAVAAVAVGGHSHGAGAAGAAAGASSGGNAPVDSKRVSSRRKGNNTGAAADSGVGHADDSGVVAATPIDLKASSAAAAGAAGAGDSASPFNRVALFAIVLHSFMDGLVIAGAFGASQLTGSRVALAILLHKLPDGFVAVSIAAANKEWQRMATMHVLFVSAATLCGTLFGIVLVPSMSTMVLSCLLSFAGGSFLFIAASTLLCELPADNSRWTIGALAAGFLVILASHTLLPHAH